MEQYNVTGMSCAACSARVEKAVSKVDGVKSCSVSLLTNSMGVEGDVDPEAIIKAVTDAGYGASVKGAQKENAQADYEDALKDTETPLMKKRLIASIIVLIPLMYVSMGHMMLSWPIPSFLEGNYIGTGLFELILAALVMVINQKFFIKGFGGMLHGAPNMDTLVAMGSAASFIYSTCALFAMTVAVRDGEAGSAKAYMGEFYFESAAMILTLITVGKMLEARSKGKTTDALKGLMKLAPKTAVLVKDGVETQVPIANVRVGDHFRVKPGENIPVDGIVVEGTSAVNEAALTGESIPVDKEKGDQVSAATVNLSGFMVCEATRVGEDTTLSQIIKMVSDAAATKAPIAKISDRVSGIFVPAVIGIAFVTFIIWMIAGKEVGFSLARAISVLVISCPCALGLATPVAIMVGNGMGAKNGIMFKTAESLEETGKVKIVALDKTGTITSGEPRVTDMIPLNGLLEEELLKNAYSLEVKSEHPLAKAIVMLAKERSVNALDVNDFEIAAGNGLSASINGEGFYGGNESYIRRYAAIPDDIVKKADDLSEEGKTVLYFARGRSLLGLIAVADVIKDDSAKAIKELKDLGIHVIMLTGDNKRTARAIGEAAGVDEVVAGVKPDGKEEIIRKLREYGKTAMVGDGINDAPALTRADIGIAIGAGTDIAIDAADVVLMKSSLKDVCAAIRLSRVTLTNIHQNLFWAFIYNIIGIPLAAGMYIPLFGWTLNPMFGAAAMSLSSFCVVSNALRLNLFKMYDVKNNRKVKDPVGPGPLLEEDDNLKGSQEEEKMEITVNGMMCPKCEAHVKTAIEKLSGVTEAVADHEKNLVTISTTADVSEADLKAAVEEAGYEYVGIKA
ncbi:MAG: heavy metal translocating P-type ATPase [Lachnospiraceae bacterium]|nr:heavy metal translocating P-type ATPase [Lachnospiraceae bacterium]